jgi:hypothetical protein
VSATRAGVGLLTAEQRQAMRQWAQITPDNWCWRERLLCALDDIDALEQKVGLLTRSLAVLTAELSRAQEES